MKRRISFTLVAAACVAAAPQFALAQGKTSRQATKRNPLADFDIRKLPTNKRPPAKPKPPTKAKTKQKADLKPNKAEKSLKEFVHLLDQCAFSGSYLKGKGEPWAFFVTRHLFLGKRQIMVFPDKNKRVFWMLTPLFAVKDRDKAAQLMLRVAEKRGGKTQLRVMNNIVWAARSLDNRAIGYDDVVIAMTVLHEARKDVLKMWDGINKKNGWKTPSAPSTTATQRTRTRRGLKR